MLRSPSANRVYAGQAAPLSAAELELTATFAHDIAEETIAGVGYLAFHASELTDPQLAVIARQSACFALFEHAGSQLRPVALPAPFALDDDLVTIPKYQGKTNEQFTQLLLGVTLAAVTREDSDARQILDPLAGRGTSLSLAVLLGHDAFGVEADAKAFEQMASFYKTYLRRKRIKHSAEVHPVRRDGKTLGKRFEATLATAAGQRRIVAFTGDTRASADLFGKKRFDVIVADAPYGVVHGAATQPHRTGRRERCAAGLLREAVGVWAGQLRHGGALGLAWNTLGLAREELAGLLEAAGLRVCTQGAWERFAHRVDSSIKRDLIVATRP